jgi:hypothetical protein
LDFLIGHFPRQTSYFMPQTTAKSYMLLPCRQDKGKGVWQARENEWAQVFKIRLWITGNHHFLELYDDNQQQRREKFNDGIVCELGGANMGLLGCAFAIVG